MADVEKLNQRIVYAGLKRMSSNRSEVQAGFDRWQSKFSQNEIDIFEIVSDLVDHLGLDIGEKKALMIGMHSASNKLFDELQAVPTLYLQNGEASNAAEADNAISNDDAPSFSKAANIETTERFFQLIGQYLSRSNPSEFSELIEIIEEESLPSASTEESRVIKQWSEDGLKKISFANTMALPMCKSLAHDLYILVSEVVGPVDADTIVNRVIDDLLKSELAQKFNPRELL